MTKARRKSGAAAIPADDVDAVVVDRHRHQARAGGDQGVAGADVAGVLEPDRVAGVDEQRGDAGKGVLGALEDEDLLGGAGDATVHPEVAGDRLAQRGEAAGLGIAHQRRPRAAQRPRREPGPERHREGVVGRGAGDEGEGHGRVGDPREEPLGRLAREPREARRLLAPAGRRRRARARVGGGADVGAVADPADDQALGGQLVVDVDDGGARQPEVGGERAARRQAIAGPQHRADDQPAQTLRELSAERGRGRAVDRDRGEQGAAGVLGHRPVATAA